MQTPFAPLQASANRTVMASLANAVAVVAGASVPVLYDQTYDAPFDTQADASLTDCVGTVADLGQLQRDDPITVAGQAFHVERAEPDGTGLVRLALRPAA